MARAGQKRPSVSPDYNQSDDEHEDRRADIKRVKIEKGLIGDSQQSSLEHGDDDSLADEDESDDQSMDHEEPDYDQEALAQAYQASKEKQRGYVGSAPQAGIIKSISLVDFMCHRHLTVDFGPKMNFLVGHNGSGKSAVLTAIAVVLGGKAVTTGRGQGLKDLIRKGADKAIITLVMANSGIQAFKPEVYNPHIVIERIISSNGSSQYKFRATKDGKTLANKRSELTAISEQFTINIDSPLTILTQDQSRSFLQNADNHRLYKFFLDGTQLSSLLHTYEMSKQNIEQLDNHIKRQDEALPDLRLKVSTLKRKIDSSDKVIRQKDKHKKVLDELAWAYVAEKQEERDRCVVEVENWTDKVEVAQVEINKAEKAVPLLDERIREIELEVVNFNESRKPLERAVREAKDKWEQARRDLRAIDSDIKECKADIASDRDSLESIQRKIDEKLRQNPAAQQAEQARLMERRANVEDLLAKLKREKPLRQQQAQQKRAELSDAQSAVDDISAKIAEEDRTFRDWNDRIGNLERQSVNRLSAFGQGLDNVMKEIQSTRWHHSPPLGPLGMFVKLEDMFYRDTIQALLGQALCSFAVRDPRDRETLLGILRRQMQRGYRPGTGANQLPPIYLHTGDLFDYSKGDLREHGPTVLSQLTVESDQVLRLLVNIANIERVFLSPTIKEANQEMTRILRGRILQQCVFHTKDEFVTSGTLSQRSSGPYQSWRGNTLFTRSLVADIEQARQRVGECEAKRSELRTARQAAQQKAADIQQEIKSIDDSFRQVSQKIGPAQLELEKTQRKLNEMISSDIEVQEGLREEARQKVETKEVQLQKFEADKEEQKRVLEERAQDIKDRQEEMESHAPQRAKRQELLHSLLQQIDEKRSGIAHYNKSKATYEEKQAREEARLLQLEQHLIDWTAKAAGFCPERVNTQRSPKIVEKEKNALEASIKEAEKQLGLDTNQLMLEWQRERKRLDESEKSIRGFKSLQKVLCRAMKSRHHWWSDTRSNIAVRARTAFAYFEQQRDLDGRLAFDHDYETLNVVVHSSTRQDAEDGASTQRSHYKTPKNLSGGERSFSTVSLLLALWSTVPCSIRALDEWDVFLDSANRKVAAKSLMDGARESDGKQFILITPQDMVGIDVSGPDKKVIRMADPTRNQGTLPFTAGNG